MADVTTAALSTAVLYQQAAGGDPDVEYSATQFRYLIGALYNAPGRLTPSDLAITASSPVGWSVDISAGTVVVPMVTGTDAAAQKFLVRMPATTVTISPGINVAPVGTRTHNLFIVVDDEPTVGSNYGGRYYVTEDTGAGAATTVAGVAGYLKIGTITIQPGDASVTSSRIGTTVAMAGFLQPWVTMSLNPGFVIASTLHTSTGNAPGYRRIGQRIELRGGVARAASATMVALTPYTVANLPIGYRPAERVQMPTVSQFSTHTIARVTVETNGDVIVTPDATGSTARNFVMLDGIHFDAA